MEYAAFRELHTDRLLLRALTAADADAYYSRLGSSSAGTKYMLFQPHRDRSEAVSSIRRTLQRYAEGRCYRWGITLQEDAALVGIVDLLAFDPQQSTCSFAYMLGEAYWSKGYCTEALRAVLDFAFSEMKMTAIAADHFAENPASGAVMRKAGMQYIRTIPGKYEKNGIRHDALEYRITLEEWKQKTRC